MAADPRRRVLIVVFDALRPEFVTPELMPNLHAFAERGVRYENARSSFPTETRVNQSAVITGCYPARHGIVANKFRDTVDGKTRVLDSGRDEELERAFRRMSAGLIGQPTLGERLAAEGLTYASISAGTSGGGRLINHAAEANGFFRLALRRPEAASPAGIMDAIALALGPGPAHRLPGLAWNSYAVRVYLDYVEPVIAPDVMLLWLSEPDESFHRFGIGSDETLRAMSHLDAEFGRILDHQTDEMQSGVLQVIAMSDHGQIALHGAPIGLAERFRAAGFDASTDGSRECLIVAGNAGGVWFRDRREATIERVADWLQSQDWCGPLFTREGAAGTLRLRDVHLDHDRAPDIALVLRCRHEENAHGRSGISIHDSGYPDGGGCHGGLSRYELHNFLAVSGGAFAEGSVVDLPAGNVDILPTVLELLGLSAPEGIDGRVLSECLRGGLPPADSPKPITLISQNRTGSVTHLSMTAMGSSRYVNEAWTE